jgi:hypothetical protein
MNYYKAVFDLGRPVEVKIPEEKDILQKMQADPQFATPPVAYADFQSALELQDKALANAQFGGLANTEALRVHMAAVDDIVRQLKLYVDAVALGRTDVILASGFRHTKPRTPVGDMPKVTNVRVVDNQKEGEVKLRWDTIYGCAFFDVEVRPKGAADDAWRATQSSAANVVLTGLTSLSYYEVRIRAKGTAGYGPYSNTVQFAVV